MKELLLAVALSLLQPTGGRPADAVAIQQFDAEIAKYMAIRRGLATEVSGPKPESTSVQLNNDSDALAAAIRRRRPNTKPGSLFTPAVADAIKRRVREADLGGVLDDIDDEKQGIDHPSVYLRFPAAVQLATMPPSLLEVLPVLPKELEYRIVGNYLVLRDVDAALILDFIPAAVPRK